MDQCDHTKWFLHLSDVIIAFTPNKRGELLKGTHSLQYEADWDDGEEVEDYFVILNLNGTGSYRYKRYTTFDSEDNLWEQMTIEGTWDISDDDRHIIMSGSKTFLRGTRKDYGEDPVVYSIFKFLFSGTRNMPKIPNTDPSRGGHRRCTEKDHALEEGKEI